MKALYLYQQLENTNKTLDNTIAEKESLIEHNTQVCIIVINATIVMIMILYIVTQYNQAASGEATRSTRDCRTFML